MKSKGRLLSGCLEQKGGLSCWRKVLPLLQGRAVCLHHILLCLNHLLTSFISETSYLINWSLVFIVWQGLHQPTFCPMSLTDFLKVSNKTDLIVQLCGNMC